MRNNKKGHCLKFATHLSNTRARAHTHTNTPQKLSQEKKKVGMEEEEVGEEEIGEEEVESDMLIAASDVTFDRDENGDRTSLGHGSFGQVLLADYLGTQCAYKVRKGLRLC